MNFFVVHFIDFRNGLTLVDKKFKYFRVISSLMVFKRNHTMETMKKQGINFFNSIVILETMQYTLSSI